MGPETQNARFIEGTKKISRERWDKGLERRAAAGAGLLLESHEMSVLNESFTSVQFSPVAQSYPMSRSTPGLPVHHQFPEFTQTHVHRVSDATQPSHPLSSPSPPASNPSQHQGLFHWVNSSHEVAKVLEFQPQNQSFQYMGQKRCTYSHQKMCPIMFIPALFKIIQTRNYPSSFYLQNTFINRGRVI